MVFGLFVLILLYWSAGIPDGVTYVKLFLFLFFFFGLLTVDLKLKGVSVPIIDYFFNTFERKGVTPAHGALWFGVGLLFTFSFLQNVDYIAASVLVLSVGDALSTIVGRCGSIPLPYNKKKTLEGLLAFIIASSVAYFFIGTNGLLLALLAGIAESMDLKIDDNVVIPMACVAFFNIAG